MNNHNNNHLIYGIIPANYEKGALNKLAHMNVSEIPYHMFTALVSKNTFVNYKQMDSKSIVLELLDYQKIIESIMNMGFKTIIPVKFGTYCSNETEVIGLLKRGYDLILGMMDKVHNHIEVDIVATWYDFDRTLSQFEGQPEVLKMKEQIMLNSDGVSRIDQIRMGHLLEKMIDKKSEVHRIKIMERLKPLSLDLRKHEVMNERMISNTAFLIREEQLTTFEREVSKLDIEFKGEVNFKLVGPLPCYSFFTLEVKEFSPEDIETAKRILGLDHTTSLKNIKLAYLEKVKVFHPDVSADINSNTVFDEISRAYQTILDYSTVLGSISPEDSISLSPDTLSKNKFFFKRKE